MKNQNLLDELGRKSNKERLTTIKENADYILSDEFISFIRGQIEFVESIDNGARYFDRVYVGEDSSFLEFMKSEMEKQAEVVYKVWRSIEMFTTRHDIKILLKTGLASIFKNCTQEAANEDLPCGKCNELIRNHSLCQACLSGQLPKWIKEALQQELQLREQTQLLDNQEIISNNKYIE